MTEKPRVWREVIERRTYASSAPMTLSCWRYRVPLTGLCGAASDWRLALDRVCESMKDYEARAAAQAAV